MQEFNTPHAQNAAEILQCNLVLTLPREASSISFIYLFIYLLFFFCTLIKFTKLNYTSSVEIDNLVSNLLYNYIVLDILGNWNILSLVMPFSVSSISEPDFLAQKIAKLIFPSTSTSQFVTIEIFSFHKHDPIYARFLR